MNRLEKKEAAARAALDSVPANCILGVGTGSTADRFIDALDSIRSRIRGAVASSQATELRLQALGFPLVDLADIGRLQLYVDGADEVDRARRMIKGGGGALTREKIVAAASQRFICIVDDSKVVDRLGLYPVAVEVIPMARTYVAEMLRQLGGRPRLRQGFVTDNGHAILDVYDLDLTDPVRIEQQIDGIAGVVASGLFCARPAEQVLVGTDSGVQTLD